MGMLGILDFLGLLVRLSTHWSLYHGKGSDHISLLEKTLGFLGLVSTFLL
jgi:hypothetical protein